MESLDYCAHAFRYCATKFLNRKFPLQFHLDRAEIEGTPERQIWDVYTPGSSFPGMPPHCRALIFLTPDHAQLAQENHQRLIIEKPDVAVLLVATWEKEGFSAVITTEGKPREESAAEPDHDHDHGHSHDHGHGHDHDHDPNPDKAPGFWRPEM